MMEEAQNTRPDLTGRYVRITGFEPGHALYRAEGTVEGYASGQAQVLLAPPRRRTQLDTLSGRLVHVDPSRLEPARRRR